MALVEKSGIPTVVLSNMSLKELHFVPMPFG